MLSRSEPTRPRRLSLRAKVIAAAAFAMVLGAGPAWAYWTAQSSPPAQPFNVGRLDLTLNGQDASVAVSGMTVTNLVPGNTVAGILTIANAGSLPLSYYATIAGTDADGKHLAASLQVAVSRAGTVSGSGIGSTCTGGTALSGASISTGRLAYTSDAAGRQPLATGASERLCIQLTLSSTAPTTVQGGTSTITMTATGEQVGQP